MIGFTYSNLIKGILTLIGLYFLWRYIEEHMYHYDYAKVHYVNDMKVFTPSNIKSLQTFVINENKKKNSFYCIKGSNFSHGGHTLIEHGTQIDMVKINHMIYNINNNTNIKLGAGCRWSDVISYLVKMNRTPMSIQSYYNFSVGGSISVNCHGRNFNDGSISDSIVSMLVMSTSGQIIYCDREINTELFNGVIGGYGLLGIIIEATMRTSDNCMMRKYVTETSIYDIQKTFSEESKMDNKKRILFNSVIYPSNINKAYNCFWIEETIPINYNSYPKTRKITKFPVLVPILEQLLRISNIAKTIRPYCETKNLYPSKIFPNMAWKSYEMCYDTNQHKVITKHPSTTVLQEYFIPEQHFTTFLQYLLQHSKELNMINISCRYVKRITNSVVNYAPVNSYSIVLYFPIINNKWGINNLTKWTNNMIDKLMEFNGKFYLPYLRTYDINEIKAMYGNEFDQLLHLKKIYDPDNKLKSDWFMNVRIKNV